MRQAGVSLEHDNRVRPVKGAPLVTDNVTSDLRRSARPSVQPVPADLRLSDAQPGGRSPQPAPNPIAAGVAERYAKALTLSATVPAPPERRTPRRSRAAMRDRALDPRVRSDRALDPRTRGIASPRQRPSRLLPPSHSPRSRTVAADSGRAAPRVAWSEEPTVAPGTPTGDSAGGIPGRRTVTIRGRGAERELGWPEYQSRRRPAVPAHERAGFRPDRAALWAFFLGLLLVLVAATSAHGAVVAHVVH